MSDFPLDETTLTLLAAACEINPDSGHTELMSFLEMTAGPITSVEMNGIEYESVEAALEDADPDDGAPILTINRAPGDEAHTEHTVILALIAEIRRLRSLIRADHIWHANQAGAPRSCDICGKALA